MFKFLTGLLRKIFGTQNERELNKLWPLVGKIGELEKEVSSLSDEALKEKAAGFRESLRKGMDEKMPEIERVREQISHSTSEQERKRRYISWPCIPIFRNLLVIWRISGIKMICTMTWYSVITGFPAG